MTHRQDIWIVYRDKLTVGEHEEYCRDETEFENKLERLRNTGRHHHPYHPSRR